MTTAPPFPALFLDVDDECLWRRGQKIPLTPKTFALLRYLVEHRNRLVTKQALLEGVWPGIYVVESEVKHYVGKLRKALGDDPKAPQFIETIRRRGYRFIGEITVRDSRSGSEPTVAPTRDSRVAWVSLASGPEPSGREAELDQLQQCLHKTLSGERQVCFITGEPGIGKTTLVSAFLKDIATHSEIWIARGQCLEGYGAGEPYMPVLEALETLYGAPGNRRVVKCLSHYAPSWLLQMPGLLESAELEDIQRRTQGVIRERMLRELAQFFEALTAEWGLILWIEDLHWADDSTLGLIAYLAQRPQQARLLVIGTYRPVEMYRDDHPLKRLCAELQAQGRCAVLTLQGLSEAAVADYLEAQYPPTTSFPPELAGMIHRHTEGNALFMVRVLAHMVAQGWLAPSGNQWALQVDLKTLELGIPDNLWELVERQLDRLDAEDQRLLEVCSVAGSTFSVAAAAAGWAQEVETVEERCEVLARRKQFIRRRATTAWPDGTVAAEYEFLHGLYHQILYERVMPLRRTRLHRLVGERMERGYSDKTQEVAAELAYHFERGRDFRRAARYLGEAADNALRRGASSEAIDTLGKAIAMLRTLPDSPERKRQELTLLICLGAALTAVKGYGAPDVEQTFIRSHELCHEMGDPPERFSVLRGLVAFYVGRARYQTARELGEQLLTLARDTDNDAHYVEAHLSLGATLYFLGDFIPALAHLEQVNLHYDPARHHTHAILYGQDPSILALGFKALVLWFLGHPSQALMANRLALARSQAMVHHFNHALALCMSAYLHVVRREAQQAETQAEATLVLATEHEFSYLSAEAFIYRGWAQTEQCYEEGGIATIRQGLAAFEATGAVAGRTAYLAILAEAHARCGQNREALNILNEGLTLADHLGEQFCAAELHQLKGEILRRHGGDGATTTAESCFRRAFDIASCQGAKSWELRAATSLARLWRDQGKYSQARDLLTPVYDWFTEGFDTLDLREAKDLLEQLRFFGNLNGPEVIES
jgi:DNA-binding winged helix-turn-helix (wHTH) protein/predicted ATPase